MELALKNFFLKVKQRNVAKCLQVRIDLAFSERLRLVQ